MREPTTFDTFVIVAAAAALYGASAVPKLWADRSTEAMARLVAERTPVASVRAYRSAIASCEPGDNYMVERPGSAEFTVCVDGRKHVFRPVEQTQPRPDLYRELTPEAR